jgi:hypothetical protein
VYVLDALGGSVLCNLGSVVMSLLAVGALLAVCRRAAVPHRRWLAVAMALHPIWWVNSTCTMDYVWAVAMLLVGLRMAMDQRWASAGLMLGLAIALRLPSAIAAAAVVGWILLERRCLRPAALVAGVAAAVGGVFYLPPLAATGWSLAFLSPSVRPEVLATWTLRLGKFAYKTAYFWGLPTCVALVVVVAMAARDWRRYFDARWRRLSALSAVVVIGHLALYLAWPLENEYLVPALPFALLLIGVGLARRRAILIAFVAAVLSYNVVNVNVARGNRPCAATQAEFGLWVEAGYLVRDVRDRHRLRDVRSVEQWLPIMQPWRQHETAGQRP